MTARPEFPGTGFMRRALRLARKGAGRTAPNPAVGAVVVRGGRVVGEGYHRGRGASPRRDRGAAAGGERGAGSGPVRDARAVRPPRPHGAVHRGDPRGGDRAGGVRDGGPQPGRLRPRREAAARRRPRRASRVDGGGGPGAQPRFLPVDRLGEAVRHAEAGRLPRRADRGRRRRFPLDHGRGGAAARAPDAVGGRRRPRGGRNGASGRSAPDRPRSRGTRPPKGDPHVASRGACAREGLSRSGGRGDRRLPEGRPGARRARGARTRGAGCSGSRRAGGPCGRAISWPRWGRKA